MAWGRAYPRLTYYQVANNFKTSDFWMKKGNFFKVQNIELGNISAEKLNDWKGIKAFRFFIRGANILTLSKIKDVDPENINSGITHYPFNKTFTGGFKMIF